MKVENLNVRMVTHAVGWQVVNGDVVLSQMLFAVLIKNIVAQVATNAHPEHASKVLMLLSYLRRRMQFR